MTKLILGIERLYPSGGEVDGDERLHRERARMLHALIETLALPVENWGNTDTAAHHEYVEIITALGTAGAFTALVSVIGLWLESNKFTQVILKGPTGSISIVKGTAIDVAKIAKLTGFNFKGEKPTSGRAKAKRKTQNAQTPLN